MRVFLKADKIFSKLFQGSSSRHMTSFYYQLQLMLILPMLFLSAYYKPMIILNGFLYKEVQKQL